MKKIIFYFSLIFCICSYGDNPIKSESRPETITLKSEETKAAISDPNQSIHQVPLYQYHRKLDKNNDKFYYDTRIIAESDKGQRDGVVCTVWHNNGPGPGTVPLYQYSSARYSIFYYDTNPFAEYKGQRDGIVCYIYKDPQDGLVPLYEYTKYTSSWGNLYYYDTRSSVESDKGSRSRIVGYVFPQ